MSGYQLGVLDGHRCHQPVTKHDHEDRKCPQQVDDSIAIGGSGVGGTSDGSRETHAGHSRSNFRRGMEAP